MSDASFARVGCCGALFSLGLCLARAAVGDAGFANMGGSLAALKGFVGLDLPLLPLAPFLLAWAVWALASGFLPASHFLGLTTNSSVL